MVTKAIPKLAVSPNPFEILYQAIEIRYENRSWIALYATPPCEFCMGKFTKTLALCAARTHIVAVR
jgi:hypothetical protein